VWEELKQANILSAAHTSVDTATLTHAASPAAAATLAPALPASSHLGRPPLWRMCWKHFDGTIDVFEAPYGQGRGGEIIKQAHKHGLTNSPEAYVLSTQDANGIWLPQKIFPTSDRWFGSSYFK